MTEATSKPRVTLCLPVMAGAPAPQASLDAALAQTQPDMAVALSLSGPDGALEAWCKTAAEDPRVSVSQRPDPVDVIGNLNHLLFKASTELVACLAPGDQPEPDWLARLVAALDAQRDAVLADSDVRPIGRGRRQSPRAALAVAGEDGAARVLSALIRVPADWAIRGVMRTAALTRAGRIPEGDTAVFALRLAREGALLRVPGALNRSVEDDVPAITAEGWDAQCAAMTEAALDLPAGVQEIRFLWLAGVARLARFGNRTAAQRETAIDAFLTRLQGSGKVDVPFLLDDEWEKIRRWTRGFAWTPRDRDEIADFGPQPVNAGDVFNAQDGGGSAVWIRTQGRLAPGTRVKLAGRVLETTLDMNKAAAIVPPDMTAKPGEYPLLLVDGTGAVRSNEVTFWVLRATAFGRGMVRLLRRMRGLPDPASVPALPKPDTGKA